MLFGSTRGAIHHLKKTAKRVALSVALITQLFYIAYLIYALASARGTLAVNITMCSIAVVYLIFFVVMELRYSAMSANMKRTQKRRTRGVYRAYSLTKLLAKTFNLAVLIYGIYVGTQNPSSISTILTTLMIILWILELILALGRLVLDYICDVMIEAIEDDRQHIKEQVADAAYSAVKPIAAPFSFLRKKFGKSRSEAKESAPRAKKFTKWEEEYKEDKRRDGDLEKEEEYANGRT